MRKKISRFPITVFGSVLGIGGFAIASGTYLPDLVFPVTLILVLLFFIFTGLFLAKVILHPSIVRKELMDPLPGNFYALQPISAIIIAILCRHLLPSWIGIGLLVYGASLIFALSVYLPYHYFSNINIDFLQLHGGWFITPVATILVTNAVLQYSATVMTITIALLFFGIGVTMFLIILSILFYRLISHALPPVELAPTNYIMLAPIGIIIVDILQISKVADQILGANVMPLGILMGVSLWGFGIWTIGINLLLFVRYLRAGLGFHLGWWSYVFPTAAFVLGTIALSDFLYSFKLFALILYVCLVAIVVIVAITPLLLQHETGRKLKFPEVK